MPNRPRYETKSSLRIIIQEKQMDPLGILNKDYKSPVDAMFQMHRICTNTVTSRSRHNLECSVVDTSFNNLSNIKQNSAM